MKWRDRLAERAAHGTKKRVNSQKSKLPCERGSICSPESLGNVNVKTPATPVSLPMERRRRCKAMGDGSHCHPVAQIYLRRNNDAQEVALAHSESAGCNGRLDCGDATRSNVQVLKAGPGLFSGSRRYAKPSFLCPQSGLRADAEHSDCWC